MRGSRLYRVGWRFQTADTPEPIWCVRWERVQAYSTEDAIAQVRLYLGHGKWDQGRFHVPCGGHLAEIFEVEPVE